ncbi:hypothetical protein [Aridibaculum aurantiacum]|uniref:hypothetical protein n=1 Tax=Aridibaculum aurantiacum TaxID=2810307 RepID=UPI001A95A348|nr:hypothetical protein [Aridibaculum aurantiacum]
MTDAKQHLEAIQDIRQMMERSSRFISLSGWSGIAAGLCALVGAHFANRTIHSSYISSYDGGRIHGTSGSIARLLTDQLFHIALVTFVAAFVLAFLFTYVRSRRQNIPIWGTSSRRLLFNVSIPMVVGGLFILKLLEVGAYGLVAPGCLIFYGLALVNASKYTLGEIRYLGFGQLILGVMNCWAIGYGIYFWAIGFGILHILYGTLMLWKYERK